MEKKVVTQKDRLKIWRAVRRKAKEILADERNRSCIDGLCRNIEETVSEMYPNRPYLREKVVAAVKNLDLKNYRPPYKGFFNYWWDLNHYGWEQRLKACNEIIKKLEHKK